MAPKVCNVVRKLAASSLRFFWLLALVPMQVGLAQDSPHVRNLDGFAERVRSQRSNMLVIGDSISTHFSSSARGTWVTAIWKEWKPDQWRGRFFPAVYHVHIPNGTWVYEYGVSPSLDPNCNPVINGLPAYPGQDLGGEFGSGWWGNFINAFETTGDLAERRLIRGGTRGNIDGQSGWEMYSDDGAWALGELRGTFTVLGTSDLLPRYVMGGKPAEGPSTYLAIDLSDQLPDSGRRLLPLSIDFMNYGLGQSNMGHVEFEVRSDESYTEISGQEICFHSGTIENIDRETGLLMGSQSMGGDRTKCHLQEGEDLFSNGMMVNRHYDDDYLAEFIEIHEWNTFLITVAANDLSGGSSPAVVVENVGRLIDRYRSAWEVARSRNKSLLDPMFLVISPHTCGTIVNDDVYASYDELVGALAGGDVAVCHLYSIIEEQFGSVDTWGDQLLVDSVHPSELGIRVMADLVWEQIELAWGGASGDLGPTHRVPGEHSSLAEAASAAEPGDRILVAGGVYSESLTLDTPGVWFYSVNGPGAARIIPPSGNRCVDILGVDASSSAPIKFEGFEFSSGSADRGGAIRVQSASLELFDCTIRDCSASLHGGGVFAGQSVLRLTETDVFDCDAIENGGGLALDFSLMDAESLFIRDCIAGGSGGGVWAADSTSNILGSRFMNNRCHSLGGGVAAEGGFVLGLNVNFQSNSVIGEGLSQGFGGGMYLTGGCDLHLITMDSNVAWQTGGGLRIDSASDALQLANIQFFNNVAAVKGGGFSLAGGGSATMRDCKFTECQSGQWAAGIHVENGNLDVSLTMFESLDSPMCQAIDVEAGSAGVSSSVFCPGEMTLCGKVKDLGGNEYIEGCVAICEGDLNGDGYVNGSDLGLFFVEWGHCPLGTYCRADLNRDGRVDGADLGFFLLLFDGNSKGCR